MQHKINISSLCFSTKYYKCTGKQMNGYSKKQQQKKQKNKKKKKSNQTKPNKQQEQKKQLEKEIWFFKFS